MLGQDDESEPDWERRDWLRIAELESRLGVRAGFLRTLLHDESDWSFLVRLQVFIEGALAHAVAAELGRPELEAFFGALPLRPNYGLAALARELDLISEDQRKQLDKLSDVRNAFAHKLVNVDRTLAEYISSMNDEAVTGLARALVHTHSGVEIDKALDVRSALISECRRLLWRNVSWIAVDLGDAIADPVRAAMRRALVSVAAARSRVEGAPMSLLDLMRQELPDQNDGVTRAHQGTSSPGRGVMGA